MLTTCAVMRCLFACILYDHYFIGYLIKEGDEFFDPQRKKYFEDKAESFNSGLLFIFTILGFYVIH